MSVHPAPVKANGNVTLIDDPATLAVTVAQAAEVLGISTKSTYKLLDQGDVECRYMGRRRLVLWDSLTAYLESLPAEQD